MVVPNPARGWVPWSVAWEPCLGTRVVRAHWRLYDAGFSGNDFGCAPSDGGSLPLRLDVDFERRERAGCAGAPYHRQLGRRSDGLGGAEAADQTGLDQDFVEVTH